MNIFIMLAILLANLLAIILIYQFIKRLPRTDKIIFVAINFAVMYVAISIVYWISGFGIENEINESIKSFITYLFVPVNIIILIPFIATKYNKFRLKEIGKEELIKRIITILIVSVVILTMEGFYFKKIKKNIAYMQKSMQLEEDIDAKANEILTNTENNEIQTNNELENQNIILSNIER